MTLRRIRLPSCVVLLGLAATACRTAQPAATEHPSVAAPATVRTLRDLYGPGDPRIPGTYDLITSFDVVHDMPHPRPAMREIKRALNPGGAYFVLEFNFSGDLQQNIDHPMGIGAFGYLSLIHI